MRTGIIEHQLAPRQVKNIMVSRVLPRQKIFCYFGCRTKSPQRSGTASKEFFDVSENEFIENFEYADIEAYVEARFASGKLNCLAISKPEIY